MAAAMTVTPASGSITATKDVCKINVTGADNNDTAAYDANKYPTSPEIRYYIAFTKGGVELGRSYVFAPATGGTHEFDNYTFPSSGSWTATLRKSSNDSSVATLAITVN